MSWMLKKSGDHRFYMVNIKKKTGVSYQVVQDFWTINSMTWGKIGNYVSVNKCCEALRCLWKQASWLPARRCSLGFSKPMLPLKISFPNRQWNTWKWSYQCYLYRYIYIYFIPFNTTGTTAQPLGFWGTPFFWWCFSMATRQHLTHARGFIFCLYMPVIRFNNSESGDSIC